MAVLGRAGSSLNIRLGQSPDLKDRTANYELQLVYNSLHLLSQYLGVLRVNLESAPGQTPSESLRFRRTFWGVAAQTIVTGAVVSSDVSGIVNGVMSSDAVNSPVVDSAVTVGSTGSRELFGITTQQFFIALTNAAPGESVQVGAGPGVLALATAKCGQLVWGVDSRSILTQREANKVNQYLVRRDYVNNGGLYLDNITGKNLFAPSPIYGNYWEGYWLPGYPQSHSGTFSYNRAFLYPIGVCIADGYVMFSDYKRSDSHPLVLLPPGFGS